MVIIDLSSPVDPSFWEPDEVVRRTMTPREGAEHVAAEMREHFGLELDPDVFPGGEFLSNDHYTLTTHTGTHIDAPAHYGSRGPGGEARTIDRMPIEWFHAPGVVLDLSTQPVGCAGAGVLEKEFARVGHTPGPGEIVLLHTGAARHLGTPRYFTDFVGLDGPATGLLLDLGVKVIGTDAFSLDAPFGWIIETFNRTGDRSVLWPAHLAGRTREYCQIERLGQLDRLPAATGFTVSCFPVLLNGAGAAWCRAVALLDERGPF